MTDQSVYLVGCSASNFAGSALEQLLENLRGKASEPWSTEMTVWQVPLVAIPPRTLQVLLLSSYPKV